MTEPAASASRAICQVLALSGIGYGCSLREFGVGALIGSFEFLIGSSLVRPTVSLPFDRPGSEHMFGTLFLPRTE
jgi:hypothetical protein